MVIQDHPWTEGYSSIFYSQITLCYWLYIFKWLYQNIKENIQKGLCQYVLQVNVSDLYHDISKK